jgi:hypothetical protein
MVELKAVS